MEPSLGRVELPAPFEDVDVDHLVLLIADMFERLMKHNDQIPLSPESLTRFHSRSPPNISILDYLRRIVKFTNVERACLLLVLRYIDQIAARNPLFTLSSLTCHRFVITSIAISSKCFCDAFCTNSHYAKVGGISVAELNLLEREFLQATRWHLLCTRDILQDYYVNLVRTHSSGIYIISGDPTAGSSSSTALSESSSSDSSDVDMDTGPSRSVSPTSTTRTETPHAPMDIAVPSGHGRRHDVPQDAPRGPTIEQNVAFQTWRGDGS
ncbi:cyclin-domain-containing protein [Punctularia strigosozonata HHB-11173 SS5]|uniref:cyclin-domain-containing protein n=1 Tax=Punctularia strigosozonata (strain HHB-11173) TaxID=741275 RepID=UPI0004417130|nr:cyclin-domain-containing protein [Punctularia strigosozonata HHB-11173 SS5]EIN11723.1 cyclin-domain-containing protein [Punctularia strigosozonata HHB-11173 SS5]